MARISAHSPYYLRPPPFTHLPLPPDLRVSYSVCAYCRSFFVDIRFYSLSQTDRGSMAGRANEREDLARNHSWLMGGPIFHHFITHCLNYSSIHLSLSPLIQLICFFLVSSFSLSHQPASKSVSQLASPRPVVPHAFLRYFSVC